MSIGQVTTRTPAELAADGKDLNRVAPTAGDKFRLMFGMPPLPHTTTNMDIEHRITQLFGFNVGGEDIAMIQGRGQIHLTETNLGTPAAIRLNGVVYVACADRALLGDLNHEWDTCKPAADARPMLEADLRASNPAIVGVH